MITDTSKLKEGPEQDQLENEKPDMEEADKEEPEVEEPGKEETEEQEPEEGETQDEPVTPEILTWRETIASTLTTDSE